MTPILATRHDATRGSDDVGFEWGLALIQVPDVGTVASRRPSDAEWERAWAERRRGSSLAARPRRRLRREFRVAACLCLAFAPVAAGFGAWGLAPSRRAEASEVAQAPPDDGEAIRLSISPAEPDAGSPVVFPGYLLPAERREEPSHEGS